MPGAGQLSGRAFGLQDGRFPKVIVLFVSHVP